MMKTGNTSRTGFAGGLSGRGSLSAFALAAALGLSLGFMPSPAPADFDGEWWNSKRDLSLQERRARRQQFSEAFMARLGPEYRTNAPFVSQQAVDGLVRAIERYRRIVSSGGWRPFSGKTTIRLNDRGRHVTELRRHLELTGDLRARSRRPRSFDGALQEAVARFQMRHGLVVTGFVGSRTRRALNVPAQVRLRQLETNLVRLRDLMKINRAKRYVLVNIPAFTLQAVERGTLALQSKVVVGKPSTQTHLISARIRALNFYPYWRVPDSIARRDLIPAIRRDPSYFSKLNFRLLPAWGAKPIPAEQIDWSSPDIFKRKFRQEPGRENALGVLRIDMPNKEILYLHDTPQKQLFDQNRRAFSAGCVRVKRVLELAAWLARDVKDWSRMRIDVTVALGKSKNVKLKKPVPVHFVYMTAWAGSSGTVHFRSDLYGRDGTNIRVAEAEQGVVPGAGAIAP